MNLEIEIPEKLGPLFEPKRYKIMHGGRGGGKSVSVGKALLVMGFQRKMRILCTRETQKSLNDSVIKLLADLVEEMGLGKFYEVQRNTIKGANGTEFIFSGLREHTIDSIKSYANIDIAWVEEAHSVSAKSWSVLVPTIRKPGSEIWATYNPDQEDDEVHRRFVIGSDPQAWVCQINWRDNRWFPEVLDAERLALKAVNTDLYDHVWEGKCRSAAGLLFKRHWFKRFDLGQQPKALNLYMASDYAGAPDPDEPDREPDWTEHGLWGIDPTGDLWAVDWWSGQEDPSVWINAWLALVRRHKPMMAFEEKGVILRTVDGSINEAMRRQRCYVVREALASAGNKASRALGFAARAAAGTVWIPNTPWGDRLVNQLCAFNGQQGRTDDMVDVCSLVGRGIDLFHDATPETPPEERGVKPFTPQWLYSSERRAPAKRY